MWRWYSGRLSKNDFAPSNATGRVRLLWAPNFELKFSSIVLRNYSHEHWPVASCSMSSHVRNYTHTKLGIAKAAQSRGSERIIFAWRERMNCAQTYNAVSWKCQHLAAKSNDRSLLEWCFRKSLDSRNDTLRQVGDKHEPILSRGLSNGSLHCGMLVCMQRELPKDMVKRQPSESSCFCCFDPIPSNSKRSHCLAAFNSWHTLVHSKHLCYPVSRWSNL